MAQKQRDEIKVYVNAVINTNGTEAITGHLLNIPLIDILDSVVFLDETSSLVDVKLQQYKYTGLSVSGSNTGISIVGNPLYGVSVSISGLTYNVGDNNASPFYFKDPMNTTTRSRGEIVSGDALHYNSNVLKVVIDDLDDIILTYITN